MLRRILGAWQVLMGERLVPFEIQSQWVAYQQILGAQLEQMSAYLARSAKAEKKRIERIQESLDEAGQPEAAPDIGMSDRDARKAELRTRVAGMTRPPGRS